MTGDRWPFAFADGLTGAVQAKESGLPAAVQFGDDAPIALSSHGMYPIAAITALGHEVLLQCVDDTAVRVTRRATRTAVVSRYGGCYGTDAVWLTPAGVAVIVRSATEIDLDDVSIPHPMPGGQGIAEIAPDGSVVPMDARLDNVVHGLRVARWSTSGRWTVAQHATRDLVVVHDGQRWLVAIHAAAPVAPRVVEQHDGSAIVTCFSVFVVHSMDFTPLVEVPAQPPPVEAFRVARYMVPKYIGVFFGSSDRQDYGSHVVADTNCEVLVHSTGPAHQRRDLPAFCSPSALAAGRPTRLLGVYCESVDVHLDSRRIGDGMQVPLGLYTDGLIYDNRYRPVVRPGDTLWLQVYPRKGSGPLHNQPDGVAESPDSVEARAVAEFDRIAAWGQNQIVIVAGWFDRLVDLTADEIRAYLPGYDRLIRRARCAGMFAFPYGRPGGILTLGLTAELSAFGRASSGVPTFRTDPTPPPIDPIRPPVDPPVDDPIDPDEGDEMPKEKMTTEQFDEFRAHVGGTIALNLGVPSDKGNQLAREVVNFFNALNNNTGPDPTVPEAIEFARALNNATTDAHRTMLGKAAEISVRLRR